MKSNQNMSILFWHRKSKADNNGYAPIICRISIDGKQIEFSTAKKIPNDRWDVEKKRILPCPEAKSINSALNRIQCELEKHFTILQSLHEIVSPAMLRKSYRNLSIDNSKKKEQTGNKIPTLLELASLHIECFTLLVEKNQRSKETLKQWKSTKKKIAEFITYTFKSKDLELSEIDQSFAHKFYTFLIVKRKPSIQQAAAMKQIKNTKQLLNIAENNKWIISNPIEKFRCGSEEPEILPLELFEVESIWRKNLSIDRLIKVRDAFIFQCFTGFAYQDIYNLSPQNIVNVGAENEKWLIKERGKTKVTEMVPILPIITEIIAKYKDDPYCIFHKKLIPVNSNFRYNCYLKELSDLCGIGRPLNSHLARHTFADLMLNTMDFPLEDVSKMLGHKNIRTTQRYARIKKKRISKKMNLSKHLLFDADGQLKKTELPPFI
ncbi:site-specific integrase [Pedobacter cryoconitis]|uniref:site-specific integrase n=1 Tax=Pedobacter cryoconitis TaxID=188932 RepID=UPI00160CFD62|nr:site-specific integrase [Pedobacter cryoconitis]MBB5645711.1 integrase [Pedobacter cryoconitis]